MSNANQTEVIKEPSMIMQKELIASNYEALTSAHENGKKVVSTFVPGNLNELIRCFDLLNNLPEINAINNGMRKKSGSMIMDAEKSGHSEDVCTYVKSDIGMMSQGNIAPNGKPMPRPDVLLLSYTGCYTFMKWFELLRHEYKCPTLMLQVPYQGDGKITPNMISYVVKQLKEVVIPGLEEVSGVKFDIDRLREMMARSAQAEDNLVWVLESSKNKPSPIDAYFGAVYYMGPRSAAPSRRSSTTTCCARRSRSASPRGRVRSPPRVSRPTRGIAWSSRARPTGPASASSGSCSTTRARSSSPAPTPRSAVSTTRASATIRTTRQRVDLIEQYMNEYEADGFLTNSIKSCNSFAAGELLMMREIEKRTGKPGAFIETDLVDPRYFSHANVKNRLESYFQMIEQRRGGSKPVAA
jgi:benzoyl-CoA reductase subunit B